MNAIRQIYENLPKTIKTPAALENRRVEVIILPLDEENQSEKSKKKANPIDKFIGAWKGEPLVRLEQGEYEIREVLK